MQNSQNISIFIDLYLKINIDLIKSAWDELDDVNHNHEYENVKKEILSMLDSIDLPKI